MRLVQLHLLLRLSREPLPLAVELVYLLSGLLLLVVVNGAADQLLPGENSVRLIRRSTNENPAHLSLSPLSTS